MSLDRIKKYRQVLLTSGVLVLLTLFMFPIVLTFTNSLMTEDEINVNYHVISSNPAAAANDPRAGDPYANMKWIPDQVTLSQYYDVLVAKPQFLFMFWNSVKIVVPILIGQIIVASLAGYAFSHLRFRSREAIFFMYIITMLMPYQVTLVPNYIIADKLGLINSYASIIFPGIFSTFGVFLLRQFMMYVPASYAEAARVDGASHLYIFSRIMLPLCKSGLAALSILVFIDNWNMVEQPLIFLQDAIKQPLSVYLSLIAEGERGIAFAACTLYMLPMILVALYAEKDLVEGIQLSGIKG
jgi:multiple sugar transport system permease protein